ncbi:hypothetical protein D5086_006719 [Populus alba]|uniref:Uncharacterized protein n=1 Tax=Populus alba TaxID=43335 RepID=A0ACC4CM65_POPAL
MLRNVERIDVFGSLKQDLLRVFIFLTFLNHIRDIKDPEHPYSLEELKVITEDAIEVDDNHSYVRVTFTPTVEHCSMATVIGLCLRVKLMRSLPQRYKVDIRVAPGTHATESAGNHSILGWRESAVGCF